MKAKKSDSRRLDMFHIDTPVTRCRLLFFIAMLFMVSSVLAIPFPQGIDGVVYDLDNITRADSSVMISVKNLNNSYFKQGNLRDDGSYSFVVKGEEMDILEITVWTELNNASLLINLTGVMHGIDLSLDLTKPGPVIIVPRSSKGRGRKRTVILPTVVTGLITINNKSTNNIIDYVITNKRTGINVTGKTQPGFNGFVDLVYGEKGDEIEIKVEDKTSVASITGEVIREDINLDRLDFKTVLYYFSMFAFLIPAILVGVAAFKYFKK